MTVSGIMNDLGLSIMLSRMQGVVCKDITAYYMN
jgi:hypothetical protein